MILIDLPALPNAFQKPINLSKLLDDDLDKSTVRSGVIANGPVHIGLGGRLEL
jgi:hypothetical protein